MADIADISSNAVIRPGLKPCWRFVGMLGRDRSANCEAARTARKSSAFGSDVVLVTSDSTRCCGAIVEMEPDGRISYRAWFEISYFFNRDGTEANVFVFNPFEKNFVRRGRGFFLSRRWA